MAELMAAYSPPMPVPAMKRKIAMNQKLKASPLIPLASK
jgi:hypothetical protein